MTPSKSKKPRPKDIDAYLAGVPDECRTALQRIRETVRAAVPRATEAFVYGVPGFKLGGRSLVCYAGFKSHCGFYPLSPAVLRAFAVELKDYDTSEGAIRFTAMNPLPEGLVRRLVKARMAELQEKSR